MTPQKCIERKCPRHGLHQGTDVCILYQVSQTKKDLAVLDVFNVTEKQCKRLRAPPSIIEMCAQLSR